MKDMLKLTDLSTPILPKVIDRKVLKKLSLSCQSPKVYNQKIKNRKGRCIQRALIPKLSGIHGPGEAVVPSIY